MNSSDSFLCQFTGLPYVDVGIEHDDVHCIDCRELRRHCDVYKEREERIRKARVIYRLQMERLATIRESLEDFIDTQNKGGEEYKLFFSDAFAAPSRKAPNNVFTRAKIVKTIAKNRRRYHQLTARRALKLAQTLKEISQPVESGLATTTNTDKNIFRFKDILRAAQDLENE